MKLRNRRIGSMDGGEKPKIAASTVKETPKPQHGLSWGQHFCFSIFLLILLLAVFIFLVPSRIRPMPMILPQPPKLEGALTPNYLLSNAKRIYEGLVKGPESIAVKDGVVYTGVLDGRVVKIKGDEVSTLARFGKTNCSTVFECGRPLGLRLDKQQKHLLVVDAYLGVFNVTLDTGEYKRIYPTDNDTKVTFLNDIDILPDGDLVVTESSVKFQLHRLMDDVMEGIPTGRVLRINPKTGTHKVLATGLYFPNGIQLAPDGQSALVAETTFVRVRKLHLSGPKTGQLEHFVDNLPGMPDNIRRAGPKGGRSGYWIGFATVRHADMTNLYDWVGTWPWIRQVISKIPAPLQHMLMLGPKYGLIVRLDETGRIVESLHDPTGHIPSSAEVIENDGELLIGSYYQAFIGKLTLPVL